MSIILIAASLFLIVLNYLLTIATAPLTLHQKPLLAFISQQVDLRNEANLATWYSSAILFLAAIVAWLNSRTTSPFTKLKWTHRLAWLLIAAVLMAISISETAKIHENLVAVLNRQPIGQLQNYFQEGAGDWIFVLLPFIIATALGMFTFFIAAFWRCKKIMLLALAGILCWSTAILFEAIEGNFIKVILSRNVRGFIEESCEVIGTTFLLIAFVEYFKIRNAADVQADQNELEDSPALSLVESN
ncbi:MAG: hypothetical protein AB1757_20045 [Acidobacteriota bacterium]